ncbi:VOC family protein [Bacillus sp. 166amftsu]|uniref:VOC family protein n=1 Tax=Bacillus sp. 166amftsu TaxID=1761753 RepID=UPI000895FE8E|nr:VOC family protein [Bacillus sp. 166amftsu]SDZ37705.1 Glyoxalase/Bleomycin resistance protein/Dioxygenase superfamily protein [Bacillus sp. 166amftsu]
MLKIGAVFIPVTDIEKSVEWYKDHLELSYIDTWPDGEGADFYFNSEKQYLSLVKVEGKQSMNFTVNPKYQNPFYNFTTNDLEGTHKRLQQKGVHVTDIRSDGPIIGFDFYDLFGNKLGVIIDKK